MAAVARSRPRPRAALARIWTPGLGLRVAARIAPSWHSLAIGAGLLLATLGAYVAARQTSMFAVRAIAIEGVSPRIAAQVETALRPLVGTSLLKLGSDDVSRRLADLTAVASATTDRDFPHTLRVEVTAEQPLTVLRQGADAWLASADGRVIRMLAHPGRSALPRVWLPRSSSVTAGETLTDQLALRAVAALRMLRAAHLGARVRDVRTAEAELTLMLGSGLEVRLGDTSNLRFKLSVARKILPLLDSPGYLDVSVPERAVADANSQVSS